MKTGTRVALVHDWLIHMRGGEKVLEALAELYPEATIYTLFYSRRKLSPSLKAMKIKASWLQRLPGIRVYYRWLLPILPWVIRSIKIDNVDLVISSSHCVAKGIPIPAGAKHVCYCHTPMRYLWGFEDEYFKGYPFFLRMLIKFILDRLRHWDFASNKSVNHFVANSENVRQRIKEYYGCEASVLYPPLDTRKFYPAGGKPGEHYLIVSAFVPYKKVDIAIKAFNSLPRTLMVVGSGPMENEYRKLRQSEQIFFLGAVGDSELRQLYSSAKAVIFPTHEDFGIVPLEAQACGTPVIAYAKGGALESIQHGVFFDTQTPQSLQEAVFEFEAKTFDRNKTAESVLSFGKDRFKEKAKELFDQILNNEQAHVAVP